MKIELPFEQEILQKNLSDLFNAQSSQNPLHKFRLKAWDHFLELGLPTKKNEVYQYHRLSALYEKKLQTPKKCSIAFSDIEKHVLPNCRDSLLVLVNGHLDLSLSRLSSLPKKVLAVPLQEAMRSFGSFINNQVAKNLQEETDPFAALNGAFIENALFLYFPPNTILENPIQILQVIEGDETFFTPRVEMFFGALSEVKIIQNYLSLNGSNYFFNHVLQMALEEGAKVHYYRTQNVDNSWHFEFNRAYLKKDSSLTTVNFNSNEKIFRDDYRITLMGPNADVSLNGAWKLKGHSQAHTHVLVNHQAPECRSLQLFKGVLDNSSQSSFEGKIYVHKEAQKTNAFQTNHNLLLSSLAQANSKPNLEIFADDVKASHGATVGQLDEDQLFYLKARGISFEQAKEFLIQGFCNEVISLFPDYIKYDESR